MTPVKRRNTRKKPHALPGGRLALHRPRERPVRRLQGTAW